MSLLTQASLILTPTAYKASTLYSIIPSNGNGDMTLTRGTNATRINSSGVVETVASNVPRLDYTSGVGSILLEPQRTNLIINSNTLSSFALVNSTRINNSTTSPDNTINATLFTEDISNTQHGITIGLISIISGNNYTYSVFYKPNGRNTFSLRMSLDSLWSGGVASTVKFNIATMTTTTETGTPTNISFINVGNGWYRASISALCSVSGTSGGTCYLNQYGGYLGDGISGGYIWGAQLEQGAYATSYIPTVGSTVTRNLDDIYRTGVSTDILNPSEGTFYVEISALANDLTSRIIEISDGTDNNKIMILYSSTSNVIRLDTYGGGAIYRYTATVSDTTTFHKVLIKWGAGGLFAYVDGVKYTMTLSGGTGTGIPTTLNRINFKLWWGGSPFYGKCKGMQIYKTALTDAECASLTTL